MKNKLLKIINPLMLLALLGVFTGLGLADINPALFIIHKISGATLGICSVLHLLLNWTWVRNAYFKKHSR